MNAYIIYIDENPATSATPWRMYSVTGVTQIKHDDRVVSLFGMGLEQQLTLIGVVKLSENASVVLADEPPQLGGLTEAPMRAVPQRPFITSITPLSGRLAGGEVVEIRGDSLLDTSNVFFGAVPAVSFSVAGPNGPIQAITPPGSGIVHIGVVTPGGTSPMTSADQFIYQDPGPPPSLVGIMQSSGKTTGGETFLAAVQGRSGKQPQITGMLFGSVPSPSVVEDPTYPVDLATFRHGYNVTTPPSPPGAVALTLVSTEGSLRTNFLFTYVEPPAPQPAVSHLSRTVGSTTGGTIVRISGTGIGDATAVHFGAVPAESFQVKMGEGNSVFLEAVAPCNQGTVPVTVTTPSGASPAAGAPTFENQPPRSLSSLSFGNQAVGTASGPRTAPIPLSVSLSDFPPNEVVPYSGVNQNLGAAFLFAGLGPTFTVGQLIAAFGDMSVTYSIIGFTLDRASASDFVLQPAAGTADVVFQPTATGYRADVVRVNVGGIQITGSGLVAAVAGALAPSFAPVLRNYLAVLVEGSGV